MYLAIRLIYTMLAINIMLCSLLLTLLDIIVTSPLQPCVVVNLAERRILDHCGGKCGLLHLPKMRLLLSVVRLLDHVCNGEQFVHC